MRRVLSALVLTCALSFSLSNTTIARAAVVPGGGDVPPVTAAPSGLLAARRGVQGPEGLVHSRILLHINTSKGAVGKPISLAPDFYYGVTDSLQLGLLHNKPMGWLTRPGAGICFSGKSDGCPAGAYNNVGFDLLYGLLFGDVHLSLHSSLYIDFIDPNPVLLTLGLTGKLHFTDDVALFFDPQVGLAVSDRDAGNRDRFFLPIELQIQLAPPVVLKLLSGTTGELSAFGDTYEIPVGLGLVGNVNETVDLGIRFSFDNLLGQRHGASATDVSSLALLLHLRF
jgi:hypothetical protein